MAKGFKQKQADLFLSDTDDIERDISGDFKRNMENNINNDNKNNTNNDITSNININSDIENEIMGIINGDNTKSVYKFLARMDEDVAEKVRIYMKLTNCKSFNMAIQDLVTKSLEPYDEKIKIYKKLSTK